MGIAAGAGGAGGAGGSAEAGARNSISKLYTADKEEADGADQGATVTDDDQFDALRFNGKEATSTFLKFNSAQVFRRFAGEEALRKWKIDGTTIAPGVMSWLFQDSEVTKLISHEFNMYLNHRRKVNEKNNLGWLRSSYHSQIQHIARQEPAYYALVTATSMNWWQVSFQYYMKAVLPGNYTAFQHLDLNLKQYIECDRGANCI